LRRAGPDRQMASSQPPQSRLSAPARLTRSGQVSPAVATATARSSCDSVPRPRRCRRRPGWLLRTQWFNKQGFSCLVCPGRKKALSTPMLATNFKRAKREVSYKGQLRVEGKYILHSWPISDVMRFASIYILVPCCASRPGSMLFMTRFTEETVTWKKLMVWIRR
jgi:hypothetical protein